MQRYWGDIVTGIVCIGLSCFFGFRALDFPSGGGTLPLFTAVAAIFLSFIMVGKTIFVRTAESREKMTFDWSYAEKKPFIVFLLALLHAWSIFVIGYFTSAILFLILSTLFVGLRNARTILVTTVVLFPLMYAFFVIFLKAQLPRGLFF